MHLSTQESQAGMTPAEARRLLEEGNQRFCEGKPAPHNLKQRIGDTASGQWPFAAVLSCIDSRVPAELVFDQGIGDIFNVRIAGNFVNDDILGSLEFSCKVAGARLIVVLGHESCGAVKGACDEVKLGKLTGMLAKITPAVKATEVPAEADQRNSSNADFVHAVALNNVHMTVANILEQSDVLREMHDAGEIAIVAAMYGIGTGEVSFL